MPNRQALPGSGEIRLAEALTSRLTVETLVIAAVSPPGCW